LICHCEPGPGRKSPGLVLAVVATWVGKREVL
jgi:hypothetical protein